MQEQQLLLEQWQAFVEGAAVNGSLMRPVTLQAWARCRDLGLSPEHLEYRYLDDAELAQKRAENASLIEAARPYLNHLSMALSDRPHAIALSDREGWIIEMRENPPDAFGGRESGICVGSSWNERHIGNNGIGTALATGDPVLVYGVEHYGKVFHQAHCLGVPIRVGSEIVGCLDVSVTRPEHADPVHLTIAQACVSSIESTLDALRKSEENNGDLHRFAALGKLLATAVHDLKGPLTVIRGIAELGEMTALSEQRGNYYKDIISNADRLELMIHGLQSIPDVPSFTMGAPSAILREVVDELTPALEVKGIEVECDLDGEARTAVVEPFLRRTFSNIVTNALHAMSSGGRLSVRSRSDDGSVIVSISDTGHGILPELRDSIFQPFVHGRAKGTGLGLYMADYTVNELHRGTITFETETGKGTTFIISLPEREVGETLPSSLERKLQG
jgi:transcriptional regulator of acetoin/glycerol metabolism